MLQYSVSDPIVCLSNAMELIRLGRKYGYDNPVLLDLTGMPYLSEEGLGQIVLDAWHKFKAWVWWLIKQTRLWLMEFFSLFGSKNLRDVQDQIRAAEEVLRRRRDFVLHAQPIPAWMADKKTFERLISYIKNCCINKDKMLEGLAYFSDAIEKARTGKRDLLTGDVDNYAEVFQTIGDSANEIKKMLDPETEKTVNPSDLGVIVMLDIMRQCERAVAGAKEIENYIKSYESMEHSATELIGEIDKLLKEGGPTGTKVGFLPIKFDMGAFLQKIRSCITVSLSTAQILGAASKIVQKKISEITGLITTRTQEEEGGEEEDA